MLRGLGSFGVLSLMSGFTGVVDMLGKAQPLLRVNVTMLLLNGSSVVDVGIPGLDVTCEDLLNLFKSLSCGLDEVNILSEPVEG
jgi:hypothetical protein